jgi:hypothetical protein
MLKENIIKNKFVNTKMGENPPVRKGYGKMGFCKIYFVGVWGDFY